MYVYILYSPKLNRYYKGVSEHPEQRLTEHNTALKASAYTAAADDWELSAAEGNTGTESTT